MKVDSSSNVEGFLSVKRSPSGSSSSAFSSALDQVGQTPAPSMDDSDESSNTNSQPSLSVKSKHQEILDKFSKYANMTPAEMIRARYLEAHGMSESNLSSLPPDVRADMEAQIKKEIERQLQEQSQQNKV